MTDGGEYSSEYSDTNVDAAIFSRADLTLNGKGMLNVTGKLKCGIASKDDLVICGLTLNVTSAGRAIEGKDCVKCSDAAITVNAGGTVSDCDQNGFSTNGKVTGGEKSFSVEISSVSTVYGSSGGMNGGMGGQPDRGMGGKPTV
ncbi:MAG: carbohydrate-binding domain-containing protein [Acutalibacteraceae bacterium]